MASWTPEHLAPSTLPNTKVPWKTIKEEQQYREEFAEAHLRVLLGQLIPFLEKLKRIPDPRRPGSVEHELTVLMVYGTLLFILQMASRREGNRELGRPGLLEALHAVFPELEINAAPHMDTVNRLLEGIEPDQLEEALRERIRSLLWHHKLQGFLVRNHYVIAIDGTQKLSRDWCWAQEAQHWQRGGEVHYTAYVLEAVLVCPQGITLPISAEFCANEPAADETAEHASARKQDCEQKAFYRLASRLKKSFPHLKILVVADGLYPNGPIMAYCRRCNWDFVFVLPADSLPSVWQEANGPHA